MQNLLYYINGEIISSDKAFIRIDDLGLLRGYGIFDFFRAIDGKPIFLEDHLDRLENSVRLMDIPLNKSREDLKKEILNIIKINPHKILGVKLVVTGGYSNDGYEPANEPNILIMAKPFSFSDPENGLKLLSIEYQREIPEIKTTNYIVPIRSLKKQRETASDDVLYYRNNLISESSRSNIFIIKNEKIITPKNGVLFGVTRKHLLKILKNTFTVEERDISVNELMNADEIFTTSSSKRIIAINNVDGKIFSNGKPGKVTIKLQDLFLKYENSL